MYAPAIMTAPYARFSTSVTPNCSVKPIAAIASTEAVTSPKPSEARKMVIGGSAPYAASARSWAAVRFPTTFTWPFGAVGVDLEDAGRVVVAVEVRRPAGSLVPDRLARLEVGGAGGEGVAHGRAGDAVADRDRCPARTRSGWCSWT